MTHYGVAYEKSRPKPFGYASRSLDFSSAPDSALAEFFKPFLMEGEFFVLCLDKYT
jgi:hypothetical protein